MPRRKGETREEYLQRRSDERAERERDPVGFAERQRVETEERKRERQRERNERDRKARPERPPLTERELIQKRVRREAAKALAALLAKKLGGPRA